MQRIGIHALLSALLVVTLAGLVASCSSPTSGPISRNVQTKTPDSLLEPPLDPAIVDSMVKYSGTTFVVHGAQQGKWEIAAAPPDDLIQKALDEAASLARSRTKYCYGSKDPNIAYPTDSCGDLYGLDCSGLISYTLKQAGLAVSPAGTANQSVPSNWNVEKFSVRLIPTADAPKKGDLLFFNTSGGGPSINHVGYYLGDQVTITTIDSQVLGPGQAIIHSAGKSDCELLTASHGVQAMQYPKSWMHLRKIVRIEKDVRRATWTSMSKTTRLLLDRWTDTLHFEHDTTAETAKLTLYYSPRDSNVQGFPDFTFTRAAMIVELQGFVGSVGPYPIVSATWRAPATEKTCLDIASFPATINITKYDKSEGVVTGTFEFNVDCTELGDYEIRSGTFSARIEY